jgi:hypothetical protein
MYYIERPYDLLSPHFLYRGSVKVRISAEVASWLIAFGVPEGTCGTSNNLAPNDACIKVAKAVLDGKCPYYLSKKAKHTLVETPALFQSEVNRYVKELARDIYMYDPADG